MPHQTRILELRQTLEGVIVGQGKLLDRFPLHVSLGYPSTDEEREIMRHDRARDWGETPGDHAQLREQVLHTLSRYRPARS